MFPSRPCEVKTINIFMLVSLRTGDPNKPRGPWRTPAFPDSPSLGLGGQSDGPLDQGLLERKYTQALLARVGKHWQKRDLLVEHPQTTIVCQYDLSRFNGVDVMKACCSHPGVVYRKRLHQGYYVSNAA